MKKIFFGLLALASVSSFAQTAPSKISASDEVRDIVKFLGSRIHTLYTGSDNYGGKFTGMIGLKGSMGYLDGDRFDDIGEEGHDSAQGFSLIPFEVQMRADGREYIRVGIMELKDLIEHDGGGIINSVKAFHFEYDDRNPYVLDRTLTALDIEAEASLLSSESSGSWIGPTAKVGVGSKFTKMDISGTTLAQEVGANTIEQQNQGFIRGVVGLAGQINRGRFSVSGGLGYDYMETQGLNNAAVSMQEETFAQNANPNPTLYSGRKTRALNVDLGTTYRLGNGRSLEIFYAGKYFKKDEVVKTYNDKTYDVTGLSIESPHNIGIRFKF